MYLTDSIGDMLTRIRNAARIGDEAVDIPASRVKLAIANLLKDEGFVSKVESLTKRTKKVLRLTLKYGVKKKNIISSIKRISTPGKRIYVGKDRIPRIRSGFGIAILSTSKGIMTDEKARKMGIGGELICHVW
jgi:small subunit ribosomal protein S8